MPRAVVNVGAVTGFSCLLDGVTMSHAVSVVIIIIVQSILKVVLQKKIIE
jgi:hypothetical protein